MEKQQGMAAELTFRTNAPVNNGELISTGAAAALDTAWAAASLGPISYPSPVAQVEGPGAESVMGSTSLGFSVFTILMPGTSNSIPLWTWRAGCHGLQTHVWLRGSRFCFFPAAWKRFDCHLWTLNKVGSRQKGVSCFLALYELHTHKVRLEVNKEVIRHTTWNNCQFIRILIIFGE